MPIIPSKDHKHKLAIALPDLDRVSSEMRAKLLAGRLDLTQIIRVGQDRMEDVPAVVMTCDLLTAATICDILRSNDRQVGDPPTGLYLLKSTSWSRITNNTVLTVIVDGKVALNPVVFGGTLVEGKPLAAKAVTFGSK